MTKVKRTGSEIQNNKSYPYESKHMKAGEKEYVKAQLFI